MPPNSERDERPGELDVSKLEQAKEHIVKALQRDSKVESRDLYNRLVTQSRAQEGCLYTPCEADAAALHLRPQFTPAPGGFTQMPPALRQAAGSQLEYHSFNGLYPQIHRAWMTIDHMIFLWDYTDPAPAPCTRLRRTVWTTLRRVSAPASWWAPR